MATKEQKRVAFVAGFMASITVGLLIIAIIALAV